MTLIVSEISKKGIVMVGDSAITCTNGQTKYVKGGAAKVFYSPYQNIGFSIWGYASTGTIRLDEWIKLFIERNNDINDTIEEIGLKLIDELNSTYEKISKPWSTKSFGIHLAGFKNNLPCLYHLHCGHQHEIKHKLTFYHDYPEDQGWDDIVFKGIFESQKLHLRNGYITHFASLFDSLQAYSKTLKENLDIDFPLDSLDSRFEYYKLLIQFVAGVLKISGKHEGVNNVISGIAFTEKGLLIDKRLNVGTEQSQFEEEAIELYF